MDEDTKQQLIPRDIFSCYRKFYDDPDIHKDRTDHQSIRITVTTTVEISGETNQSHAEEL